MLVLLPIFLLLLTALSILLLQRIRPAFGFSWVIAALSSVAAWGILLAFHWYPPPPFVVRDWIPAGGFISDLSFGIDNNAWPYGISLVSLVVGAVLTAGARLQHRSNPIVWAGSLAITAMGLFGTFATSPLALLLAWSSVDLFELAIMLGSIRASRLNQQAVIAFSARAAGSFLVILAMAVSYAQKISLTLDTAPPGAGVFLLVAAGLRLGVLPLHLPYPQEVLMRRGLGNMLRMVAPASSLVILARLPASAVPSGWAPYMLAFTGLSAVYGGVMWLTAEDEVKGRPYWIIALAGMAISCVIQGQPAASLAWGVALLLSGGVLFLFSARRARILFIPALGVLALTGLPFTPAASGWTGLLTPPFNFLDSIFLLAMPLLIVGYVRHALRPGDALETLDRWIQVVYPFGLFLVAGTFWVIGVFGWPGSLTVGVWWGALSSALLALGGWLWLKLSSRFRIAQARPPGWFALLMQQSRERLAAFFRLEWAYQLLGLIYQLLQRIVQLITTILEGDGGVLWVLLLLALLVSMIQGGAKP
jgi:hypothetical protein